MPILRHAAADLEGAGTLTNMVVASGQYRPGNPDFYLDFYDATRTDFFLESAAGESWAKGTLCPGSIFAMRNGNNAAAKSAGSSLQNGTVICSSRYGPSAGGGYGPIGRKQSGATTFWTAFYEPAAGSQRVRIYSVVAGVFTLKASSAVVTLNAGQQYTQTLSFNGSTIYGEVAGTGVSVSDADVPDGGEIGYFANPGADSAAHAQPTDWVYARTVALSHTATLPTLDAGSALEVDAITWDQSLSAGTTLGGITVRGWTNADRTDETEVTGLTAPNGEGFTAMVHRYFEMEASLSRGATTDDFFIGAFTLSKGNDAGGGGGGAASRTAAAVPCSATGGNAESSCSAVNKSSVSLNSSRIIIPVSMLTILM